MATLSPARAAVPLLEGLPLLSRGKVRDSYGLPDGKRLIVATDGISVFDLVLNALIPEKGMILTAMNHFWLQMLHEFGVLTHFVAAGVEIDVFLPDHLRGNPELQSRAMVVEELSMHRVEFVVRAHLTGTGFRDYKKDGAVCGHILPRGLEDGDCLPYILDTPTTKEENGHDKALPAAEIRARFPEETYLSLKCLQIGSQFAERFGIILADTKFEMGLDMLGRLCLGDEALTPDSSRWWLEQMWLESQKAISPKAPSPFDKQIVRNFGIEHGLDKLDPKNPDHVATAHVLEIPERLVKATTQTYRYIFWRLVGQRVESYLRSLGVTVRPKKKKLAIVFGSESDIKGDVRLAALQATLSPEIPGKPGVHVISCHRNDEALDAFAASGCGGADVVIAAGGKAFALPGVLDAKLHRYGYDIPVVGVALGEPGSRALEAAKLSIAELPGQPVVMDESVGEVYAGDDGFRRALERVARGELPPPQSRVERQAKFNIDLAKL